MVITGEGNFGGKRTAPCKAPNYSLQCTTANEPLKSNFPGLVRNSNPSTLYRVENNYARRHFISY